MNLSEDDLRRMGYEIRDGVAMRAEKGVIPTEHQTDEKGRWLSQVYPSPLKRSKYRNKPCYVGEVRFDSQHEAECWLSLQLMQQAGTISQLERQIPYELHCGTPTGLRIVVARYFADFRYRDANGLHVCDAKSEETRKNQVYRLKARWLNLEYGISIEEL